MCSQNDFDDILPIIGNQEDDDLFSFIENFNASDPNIFNTDSQVPQPDSTSALMVETLLTDHRDLQSESAPTATVPAPSSPESAVAVAASVHNLAAAPITQFNQPAVLSTTEKIPADVQKNANAQSSSSQTKCKRKRRERNKSKKALPESEEESLTLGLKKKKLSPDGEATSVGTNGGESLPETQVLKICLYYQSDKLCNTNITAEDGCIVYYNKIQFPPETNPGVVTSLAFPDLSESLRENFTNKQSLKTEQLLAALKNGIHIYFDKERIYAKRLCNAHVFCYSTDMTAACDDKPSINPQLPKWHCTKLKQYKQEEVFNNNVYERKLLTAAVQGGDPKLPLPGIVFTFGQVWDWPKFPVSNCLVHMTVTPMHYMEKRSCLNEKSAKDSIQCNNIFLETSFSSMSLNSK